ncbi:MAG: holin, BlyA family protein [Lachnospiraceae bacterium]|nr:holin, BlyA family protein [Lachnospiraceae bacterium]
MKTIWLRVKNMIGRRECMRFKEFLSEEDGIGVVEVILILVVLIALVLIFKQNITELVNSIFSQISSDSNQVMGK